jgi:hypothetical protein
MVGEDTVADDTPCYDTVADDIPCYDTVADDIPPSTANGTSYSSNTTFKFTSFNY